MNGISGYNQQGSFNPQQFYNQPPYNYLQQQQMEREQRMAQYSQQMAQYNAQNQPQQAQIQKSIDMVNGYENAVLYVIQPNTSIPLFDSQEDKMYLKSMDANGNIKIDKFNVTLTKIEDEQVPQLDTTQFATTNDFQELKTRFDSFVEQFNTLLEPTTPQKVEKPIKTKKE